MNDVLESIMIQSDLDAEIADFLSHHGVKGQRWGIRNARATSSRGRGGSSHKGLKTAGKVVGVIGATAAIATGAFFAQKTLRQYNVRKTIDIMAEPRSKALRGQGRVFTSKFLRQRQARSAINRYATSVRLREDLKRGLLKK